MLQSLYVHLACGKFLKKSGLNILKLGCACNVLCVKPLHPRLSRGKEETLVVKARSSNPDTVFFFAQACSVVEVM